MSTRPTLGPCRPVFSSAGLKISNEPNLHTENQRCIAKASDDVDCFHVALFSTLQQTHCTGIVILHESIAFYSTFFFQYPPKWCTYSTGMAGAT